MDRDHDGRRESLEDLYHEIDDLVGPPESETNEDHQKRTDVIDGDRERRQKRNSKVA